MAEDIAVRAAGPLHTMSQRGVPPVSWEHDKSSVALSNLEPDTEYECKVSEVDLQGNPKPDSPVYTNSFRSPSK
jgi:hypothetical protein